MTLIEDWVKDVIEGVGGMHDWEKYELVVHHVPRDIAVSYWILRCLANPKNEGSQAVLDAIHERRNHILGQEDK